MCIMFYTSIILLLKVYYLNLSLRITISQYETKYIENCEILKDVIQRDTSDDAIYHPVKCMECDLEIGLEDCESVVHFYQVVAS